MLRMMLLHKEHLGGEDVVMDKSNFLPTVKTKKMRGSCHIQSRLRQIH
jgi:hypothetical protein